MNIETLQKLINEHRKIQNLNTKLILDSIQKWIDNINYNTITAEQLETQIFWHTQAINQLSYIRL
jgi:hypothetical protein